MGSWKELHDRYDELKDLSEKEVMDRLGDWWGPIFLDSKKEIERTLWRRPKEAKEEENGGCSECEIK